MATITPVVGSIGQKTDRNNLLTYSLTGTMSTITEKVNGVVVGTKTATSGQSLTVALTQVQWDDAAFGKYGKYSNLIPAFNSGLWTLHANVVVNNSNKITLNATASGQSSSIIVTVKPNTVYLKNAIKNGFINVTDEANTVILANDSTDTFNTGSRSKVRIELTNAATGTFTFENVMLIEGSIVKPFVPFGGNNTLTIEMGSEIFTYTFDKRLATDADLLSAVKATKDVNEVFIPTVKNRLATNLTTKGQTSAGTETLDALVDKVALISIGKKWASGTGVSSATNILTVTGLDFTPSQVLIHTGGGYTTNYTVFDKRVAATSQLTVISATNATTRSLDGTTLYVRAGGFALNINIASSSGTWIAIE